ncbi:ArsR/SmtB family transcription factor [Niveispirillum cyanobacteriorum]|uniref:Transcriptional regulator n=1 Tax=Niveispirillum cyanobacteriorum TaxID=1612173 RepID=A0A2K9N9E6_9PROT|nr:helix-turn-helix transcriptional regulator [Niveispirillum cyanobacteriorum]AUN29699.1 transcriptional regulator [Niveispirillum cyanobacteriorum]GGE61655.1 ArsR family transcriptional regulator [Niveispirillum cyanobacteriorum]
MVTTADFAEIAALAGDPTRACMLQALMDGRALTAAELAHAAGITAQTASGHLSRMVTAGLLHVEQQGRHRYHRLASLAVARMMESIMQVAADRVPTPRPIRTGPRDRALAQARTCYDHLAGRLGVALADAMVAGGHVELAEDAGLITTQGRDFLSGIGVVLPASGTTRAFCRPCLDWSERRPHLAGTLGRTLCNHAFDQGWVRRVDGTRAVSVTPKGAMELKQQFGVDLAAF